MIPQPIPFTLFKSVHPHYFGIGLRGHCIGAAACAQLDSMLDEAYATHAAEIWLDCENLDDIDVQGLRVLFAWFRKAQASGASFYVCGLCPTVCARLENSGLATVLPLLPTEAFRGPRPFLR